MFNILYYSDPLFAMLAHCGYTTRGSVKPYYRHPVSRPNIAVEWELLHACRKLHPFETIPRGIVIGLLIELGLRGSKILYDLKKGYLKL